jgi:hypothetical protein
MGRSPGFASIAPDHVARLRLAFAGAPPLKGLTDAGHDNSPDHYAKGTRSGRAPRRHSPPTARRHGVSGSVSSPGRGSSHRSVALLGSLSVVTWYLALRDGPRRFRPGFTCPTLLGYRSRGPEPLAYGTVTRSGATFQWTSVWLGLGNSHVIGPTTPGGIPPGLGWSPFARRY